MAHLSIVEADEKHIEAWKEMRIDLWPECAPERHEDEIRSWLANPDIFPVWIALDSDNPVGFIECSIHEEEPDPIPWVEGIYVARDSRRKGIAKAMIDSLVSWSRERGFTVIGSDVEIKNGESTEFHKALGFELYRSDDEAHFFRRPVPPSGC